MDEKSKQIKFIISRMNDEYPDMSIYNLRQTLEKAKSDDVYRIANMFDRFPVKDIMECIQEKALVKGIPNE